MSEVDDIRQSNRASPFMNGLSMVAYGVGSLVWVTVEFKPADYVAELFGGAQMYGNKVLSQYKDKYVASHAAAPEMNADSPQGTRHKLSGSGLSTKLCDQWWHISRNTILKACNGILKVLKLHKQ